MKKILLFYCLFAGTCVQAQKPIKSSRIATKSPSVVAQQENKITQVNVLKSDATFSSFTNMNLKLPFTTTTKDNMVQKMGHFYVLNGDIIVGNDFPKTMLYSSDDHDYRWPIAIIPYVVDQSIYAAGLNKIVFEGIAEFNGRTKLCLVRRTNQDDYIKIVFSKIIDGGGLSYVGRQEGEQHLYLSASATKGTVIHELMHAAGFYHEQCRSDRDQFVKINKANVKSGLENNFQIEEDGVARSTYDYCSIMHYSSTAFSKNKLPTIECIQNGMTVACPPCIGNRETFSDADIKGIDWFYSNANRFPCEPLPDADFVAFPYQYSTIYPSASQAAMAAFRHCTDVAYKERHVSEFIKIIGAYPNMHEVKQGANLVGGTVFLYSLAAQWQDVPLTELGNPSMDDFASRMRATQTYAVANGFIGGFPTFYHADYGKGIVCGTVLIGAGGADWRDVPIEELGSPPLDDIKARMVSANDYAFRNGYLGGFPTFYHADNGKGIVCGIVLIKKSAGEWRDVIILQGPR